MLAQSPFFCGGGCGVSLPAFSRRSLTSCLFRPSPTLGNFSSRVSIAEQRGKEWPSSPCFCSRNKSGEVQAVEFGDPEEGLTDDSGGQGYQRSNGDRPANLSSSKDLMQKLKRYGIAGVLSYGLLNTVYYLTTFLLVWFYIAPASGRMGYAAAVERFLKIMAMVWAGSQVTKILRAGGALALAPLVDRGLAWFTVKFNFDSRGKAFAVIAGSCFCLALLLFFGLTLFWA